MPEEHLGPSEVEFNSDEYNEEQVHAFIDDLIEQFGIENLISGHSYMKEPGGNWIDAGPTEEQDNE